MIAYGHNTNEDFIYYFKDGRFCFCFFNSIETKVKHYYSIYTKGFYPLNLILLCEKLNKYPHNCFTVKYILEDINV